MTPPPCLVAQRRRALIRRPNGWWSHVARIVVCAPLALAGCDLDVDRDADRDSGVGGQLLAPSRDAFAAEIGPILTARCADHACHGNDAQPFALYAVARRRLAVKDIFTSRPLSSDEVEANYNATRGFLDAERGRDTTLVRKALGLGGSGGHKGGVVFEAPSDPRCRALIQWIDGALP